MPAAASADKFDVIFELLAIAPKRSAVAAFAIPITIKRQGFIVLKSNPLAAEAPYLTLGKARDPQVRTVLTASASG